MYSLSKNLILLKKIYSVKQTHSVKDGFYFQFSFATNEQALNDSEKIQVFFSDSALVIWSSN